MTDTTRSLSQEPLLLADLSSPETRDLVPRIELVLLPVGAHEQHGPNIAVSTDTISADALCRAAAALVGPAVAVAPVVPWGVSWHHLRFAGTIASPPIHADCRAGGRRRLTPCARLAPLPGRQRSWRQHCRHHHRDRADQARHGCAIDRVRVRLCLDCRAGEDPPAGRGDRSWRRRRGGSGNGCRATSGEAVRLRPTAADGRTGRNGSTLAGVWRLPRSPLR